MRPSTGAPFNHKRCQCSGQTSSAVDKHQTGGTKIMPSNGSSKYWTTQHRKSHITEGNQSQCNHHIHHNNAEGKQQRERQVWPKTEPNKSPNQHHHPIVSQIKQARALTNRTKQNTNHRAIGKLGTGQTGKQANNNQITQPIASTPSEVPQK